MSDERNYNLQADRPSFMLSNGNGHQRFSARQIDVPCGEENRLNLKLAAFCLAVALAMIVADALGRIGKTPSSASDRSSMGDVTLVVRSGPYGRTRLGFAVPFRLSNMGRRAVFYPVRPGTDVPIGQILVRNSRSSEWTNQFGASDRQAPGADPQVTWIEMPPGGWIDGKFEDRIESSGDHAYAISLKPDRGASSVRIISEAYLYNRQ